MRSRILVIRLGALGDMVLSFPAFAAIRAHHASSHITLLTTPPFEALARDSPWFDAVSLDTRPGWADLAGLWRLRRKLRGFGLVYDLQTSRRSSRYFRLAGRPPWSGIAPGCSLPDPDPLRDTLHSIARQRGQLQAAGVPPAEPDLDWLAGRGPVLAGRTALLIPGTSPSQGGAKKWPAQHYAALAVLLREAGLVPVVIGTSAERQDAAVIARACPEALDLTGQTSIQDVAGLASRATLAVGGDTGPLHLAAMMGCRVLALFSRFSKPSLAAPVGESRLIQSERLSDIPAERVFACLQGEAGGKNWVRI